MTHWLFICDSQVIREARAINVFFFVSSSSEREGKKIHLTIYQLIASLVAQMVKCLPTIRETRVRSLGGEDLLEEEMAIHSSTTAKSFQSCLTLCDPIDSSPPGSPVPGILQARTLEWVAISFSSA